MNRCVVEIINFTKISTDKMIKAIRSVIKGIWILAIISPAKIEIETPSTIELIVKILNHLKPFCIVARIGNVMEHIVNPIMVSAMKAE